MNEALRVKFEPEAVWLIKCVDLMTELSIFRVDCQLPEAYATTNTESFCWCIVDQSDGSKTLVTYFPKLVKRKLNPASMSQNKGVKVVTRGGAFVMAYNTASTRSGVELDVI